jgi:UDP-glucose:(heptosyl)LPS alpha-1,3-glucosyltransferase
MKIAIIIEHFDPARGGAERFAVWLAEELVERGHEVHVVCHDAKRRIHPLRAAHQGSSHDAARSEHSHGQPEPVMPEGVHVHRLRGLKLSTGMGFRLFGRRARLWCKRHRPDVAHSITVAWAGDLYHPQAGVYQGIQAQAIAARDSKREMTLKRWAMRLSSKQRALLVLERRAVQPRSQGGPWKIFSLSQMMSEEFARYYGVGDGRLIRLDNPRMDGLPELAGLDVARARFRAHYGLGEADSVAAFVGHDFRRKGLRWAIEAIAQSRKNWKLLVVGLGKCREYVEHAQRLGVSDRVKFVGPTRDMNQVYAASDALLLPTFYDSFGFVGIEALSYGLPVISTRFLGCAPVISQNHLGTIVESPKDAAAMAEALDCLPNNGRARAELAQRARDASAGMTGEEFMRQTLQAYEQLCRHERRGQSRPGRSA